MKDTFCIGDVHGCYFTLMALIEKLPDDAELIFMGDLCDKGNHSEKVISYIIENGHSAIRGNHDHKMMKNIKKAFHKNKKNLWTTNMWGGEKTLESYTTSSHLIEEHIEFIKGLPYFIKIDNYFLTHGFGLPYYKKRKKKKFQKFLMRNRVDKPFDDWEDFSNYKVINVFGHCDYDEVRCGHNYFGIDTGAVYGRKLTAFKLGTHETFEEEIHKKDIL